MKMIAFGVLLATGLMLLSRSLAPRSGSLIGGESSLEILKKRFALGEISTEEFEEKRALILDDA